MLGIIKSSVNYKVFPCSGRVERELSGWCTGRMPLITNLHDRAVELAGSPPDSFGLVWAERSDEFFFIAIEVMTGHE